MGTRRLDLALAAALMISLGVTSVFYLRIARAQAGAFAKPQSRLRRLRQRIEAGEGDRVDENRGPHSGEAPARFFGWGKCAWARGRPRTARAAATEDLRRSWRPKPIAAALKSRAGSCATSSVR